MQNRPTPSLVPTTKPPTPFFLREVVPDWYKLFESVVSIAQGMTAKKSFTELIPTVRTTLASLFKLKPTSAEEEAFRLILKSVGFATASVIRAVIGVGDLPIHLPTLTSDRVRELDAALRKNPVVLNQRFIESPINAPVVKTAVRLIASLLRTVGVPPLQIDTCIRHLPMWFVSGLMQELADHPEAYTRFVAKYHPNWKLLAEAESEWAAYHTQLAALSDPDVLDLGVRLDQVYVDLRAYTVRTDLNGNSTHTLGMLDEFADHWLADPTDAVFVVSGGPGAGKSAFARRFAARAAWDGPDVWRVLFVPLHRFSVEEDLGKALRTFLGNDVGTQVRDPFTPGAAERMLVVFDGLDELAQKGSAAKEAAAEFYERLETFLSVTNGDRRPVQVKAVVCGRPVAVSQTKADVRTAERVRHVLPYHITARPWNQDTLTGQPSLAERDQRDEWWQKYGTATGRDDLKGLPGAVKTDALDPLTAEPILNALVARMWRAEKLTADSNRADVYDSLLEDVLDRVHDERQRRHLTRLTKQQVVELLEEVAVTAWHSGDVRATTKSRVQTRCELAGQKKTLEEMFPDQSKSDVTPLFLAFYFQSAGRLGDDPAFEFSHKSFGEFLLARRIVRFLKEKAEWFASGDPHLSAAGMKAWLGLFGHSAISADLYEFIRCVARRVSDAEVEKWVQALYSLFARAVVEGFHDSALGLKTFREMEQADLLATGAILTMRSSLYRADQPAGSLPDHLDRSLASAAVRRVASVINLSCNFSGWDLKHCDFQYGPFFLVNLRGADLRGAQLSGAILRRADLQGADLQGAQLPLANLRGAQLPLANLHSANLHSANLLGADLFGANLFGVILSEATLSGTNLQRTNLEKVDLQRANLIGAHLHEANLEKANLSGANLQDARLTLATVEHQQLLDTIGDPAVMPDGGPPAKNWREKKPTTRKPRKKATPGTTPDDPPPPVSEATPPGE